jgi:molybdopterin synthase sulfur carrier subunit
MSITVRIPTQLRPLTAGVGELEVEAVTVREAIEVLDMGHPGIKERLLDDKGSLRRFVNLFVADEDVRFLQGLDTGLPAGTTLSIIPAVAGG